LSYLHHLSIIHGDVKGVSDVGQTIVSISHKSQSNILINGNGEASLADFGLSRILEKSGFTTRTTSGTWRYMALELVSPPGGEYEDFIPRVTAATDVWAFAMTVVEVCDSICFVRKLTPNGFRSSLNLHPLPISKATLASLR
jgi:serine/threonine protein kinase